MGPGKAAVVVVLAIAQIACGYAWAQQSSAPHTSAKPELAQAAASPATPTLADLLARAKLLADAGRVGEAYALLAGAEDLYIGEIDFDYALGRAALAAGRPDRATLAFARVIALDPSHAGALIDTGRAYLALGNFVQARAAFETLLSLDPPPSVRLQLQAYLAQALRTPSGAPSGPLLTGYLAATLGKSTNVNQSPAQGQVFVPAFGATFELAPQNVRIADRYWSIAGGADLAVPLDRRYSIIGGLDIVERENFQQSSFDLSGVGARLGIAASGENSLVRLQAFDGRSFLGHEASRDIGGLALDAVSGLNSDTQLEGFAQTGWFRYVPGSLLVFDADFVTLGFGAAHRFAQNSTFFVGISTGEEKDVGGNPSGDKRYVGLRMTVEAGLWARTKLIASAAPVLAQYDKIDPVFLDARRDFLNQYELIFQYALDDRTVLRPGITYAEQHSNIPIFEFRRTEYWLMLRREFR
jgi:hypothetical protein